MWTVWGHIKAIQSNLKVVRHPCMAQNVHSLPAFTHHPSGELWWREPNNSDFFHCLKAWTICPHQGKNEFPKCVESVKMQTLTPTEMLQCDIKGDDHLWYPTNVPDLTEFFNKECSNIPTGCCAGLIHNYQVLVWSHCCQSTFHQLLTRRVHLLFPPAPWEVKRFVQQRHTALWLFVCY